MRTSSTKKKRYNLEQNSVSVDRSNLNGWGNWGFKNEGNGNPLQYFCLENLMDREAW